jgi:hypothetical protein
MATALRERETGLFKVQARYLLQFRPRRQNDRERQTIIDSTIQDPVAPEGVMWQAEDPTSSSDKDSFSTVPDQSDSLTRRLRTPKQPRDLSAGQA